MIGLTCLRYSGDVLLSAFQSSWRSPKSLLCSGTCQCCHRGRTRVEGVISEESGYSQKYHKSCPKAAAKGLWYRSKSVTSVRGYN
jgi:hypothetical protein